jgi:hypothetical protein
MQETACLKNFIVIENVLKMKDDWQDISVLTVVNNNWKEEIFVLRKHEPG